MKLIGLIQGVYEGNRYARLITTEDVPFREGCRGLTSVISKCNPDLGKKIFEDWDLYNNQDVVLGYDRFGKVQSINLE